MRVSCGTAATGTLVSTCGSLGQADGQFGFMTGLDPGTQQLSGARAIVPSFNHATFSVGLLLNVLTLCGLFLAICRSSPLAAISATIVLTPAFLRTAACAELWRLHGGIPLGARIHAFVSSLMLVTTACLAGMAAALAVCSLFGLAALVFEMAMTEGSPIFTDAVLLGASGGMVFGMAAGIAACTAVISRWWWIGMPMPASRRTAPGLG